MPAWPRPLPALLAAAAAALALSAAPARAAISLPPGFVETPLATGLTTPVDVTWAPDGRMFVANRAGIVTVHDPGDPPGVNSPLLDISGHVNNGPMTDHGLLGIATDVDFASNGYLYLLYTYDNDTTDDNNPKVSTLTRVTVTPQNTVGSETRILGVPTLTGSPSDPNGVCDPASNTNDCIPSEGSSHTIGTVRSAPDGTLFVGTGDGDDFTKADPLALNDDNPLTYRGKIMHVDRDGHGLPGHPFCPADNTPTDVCTKIYAEGMRNPFRFSLLPGGGLAIGDVGQGTWEEIDLAHGGEDFGWPCFEGNVQTPFTDTDGHSYEQFPHCQAKYANNTTTAPAMAIAHNYPTCDSGVPTGDTIVGGPIYEGDQYPAGFRGQVIFGDVGGGFFDPSCGWIGRASISGNSLTGYQSFATGWPEGVDLESAPDGNLVYVSLSDGAVREITYGPGNHRPATSPSAAPTTGQAPMSVSFKANGSDPDGDALNYGWDFGDGTPHSSAANPTHVYKAGGNRVATVTVDDGRGMSATGTVQLMVAPAPPTSNPPRVKLARLRLSAGIAGLAGRGLLRGSFRSASAVKTLDVSLWRGNVLASASCRWWSRRSHALRRGACSQPHWMKATLHRHGRSYTWTLKLGGVPPAGRYTLVFQAVPRSKALAPSARTRVHLRVRR